MAGKHKWIDREKYNQSYIPDILPKYSHSYGYGMANHLKHNEGSMTEHAFNISHLAPNS